MPTAQARDGVAFVEHGDTISVLWQGDARVHRAAWLFDHAEKTIAQNPGGVIMLQLILSSSRPPDAETRADSAKRLKRLGPKVRRVVTVPVGDNLWANVVRTIMRAMYFAQGKSGVHAVGSSIEDGILKVIEAATPSTPTRAELVADVQETYRSLGLAPPRLFARE